MIPTFPIVLTRADVVEIFRRWETDRRLHPTTFSSTFDEAEKDVVDVSETSAETFLRLLDGVLEDALDAAKTREATTIDAQSSRPDPEELVTAESAAREAAAALRSGAVAVADGWTRLAAVLS
jgi:hypothetical protein